jgi:hypothetical protein
MSYERLGASRSSGFRLTRENSGSPPSGRVNTRWETLVPAAVVRRARQLEVGHGFGTRTSGPCARQSAYASAESSVFFDTDASYFAAVSLTV